MESLSNLKNEMNLNVFSLQDLAVYYEKFNNNVCKIVTSVGTIRFKFDIGALPHLLGIGHTMAYSRNRKSYIGVEGFKKLKNGEVTYDTLKNNIKSGNSDISWKGIKERICFFVMFLNTLNKAKMCVRNDELLLRKTKLKGNYFLYRNCKNNKYPLFSIKKINLKKYVLETFIVESKLSLIGALNKVEIFSLTIEKQRVLVKV